MKEIVHDFALSQENGALDSRCGCCSAGSSVQSVLAFAALLFHRKVPQKFSFKSSTCSERDSDDCSCGSNLDMRSVGRERMK